MKSADQPGRPFLRPAAHTTARLISSAVLAACLMAGAPADVVYLRDGTQLFGRLVEKDDSQVVLDARQPDGTYVRHSWQRDRVVQVVVTIDDARLAQLHPSQPLGYLEYAEELSAQRRDPEAAELAVRLFLIAAWHGDQPLRRTALLGLIDLAPDAQQRRLWLAAALQWDPGLLEHAAPESGDAIGVGRFRIESPAAADGPGLDPQATRTMIRLLRLARTGKGDEALDMLRNLNTQRWAEQLYGPVGLVELRRLCLEPQLSLEQLLVIVDIERRLSAAAAADAPAEPPHPAAGVERGFHPASPIPASPLTGSPLPASPLPASLRIRQLDAVLDIDPRHCLWRDGRWIEYPDNTAAAR